MDMISSTSDQDPVAVRKAADADYFRKVLLRLIAVSADMVEMELDQARAQAAYTVETGATVWPAPERSIAIGRLSRCIRRSISLARRLDEPVAVDVAGRDERRVSVRARIERAVEGAIERHPHPGENEAEALHAGLRERLDAPELDDFIDARPATEIIAAICRSLGLTPPAGLFADHRRAPAEIAALGDSLTEGPPPGSAEPSPGLDGDGASALLCEARFRGKRPATG